MNRSNRSRALVGVSTLAIVLLGAAGYAAWQVFGTSAPPPAALSSAEPSASASNSSSGSAGSVGFDGTWSVDASGGSLEDGTSTFAGYRIEEELASIGTSTAVGRTQQVGGSMTIEGTEVTAMDLTVDMTSLQSDEERRDGQLASRGLETDTHPTATFRLTEPVDVGAEPKQGQEIGVTVSGALTMHGVTQQVQAPIQARWTGDRFEVVASLDVALADYQIEAPVGFSVLSVADTGTIELHVLFQKD